MQRVTLIYYCRLSRRVVLPSGGGGGVVPELGMSEK